MINKKHTNTPIHPATQISDSKWICGPWGGNVTGNEIFKNFFFAILILNFHLKLNTCIWYGIIYTYIWLYYFYYYYYYLRRCRSVFKNFQQMDIYISTLYINVLLCWLILNIYYFSFLFFFFKNRRMQH